jgi:hypothetical protein
VITVKLTVPQVSEQNFNAYICEGETYTQNNFTAQRAGIYKQKLLSAATGCDSLVTLNLTVEPIRRTNVFDTICQGNTYTLNGIAYNRSGLYTDTLSSRVTGCDSIVSLYLTVRDAIRRELTEVICYGETYTFGSKTLNTSGIYIDTLQNSKGCDSIVTLNLTAKPELKTIIDASTAGGESYTGNGFVGIPPVAGDYTRVEITADGCDSTIVLRLTIITGLHEISIYDLKIVPTVISAGESIRIIENGQSKIENVQVLDLTGKILAFYRLPLTAEKSVEIRLPAVAGVYIIKAADSNGKIRHGRVIVK